MGSYPGEAREAVPRGVARAFDPGPLGHGGVVEESLQDTLVDDDAPAGRHALAVERGAGQPLLASAVVDDGHELRADLLPRHFRQEARALEDALAIDRSQDPAEQGPGDVGVEDDRGPLRLDGPRVEHVVSLTGGLGRDLLRIDVVLEEVPLEVLLPARHPAPRILQAPRTAIAVREVRPVDRRCQGAEVQLVGADLDGVLHPLGAARQRPGDRCRLAVGEAGRRQAALGDLL